MIWGSAQRVGHGGVAESCHEEGSSTKLFCCTNQVIRKLNRSLSLSSLVRAHYTRSSSAGAETRSEADFRCRAFNQGLRRGEEWKITKKSFDWQRL